MSKNPGGGASSNPRPDEGENFANVFLVKSGGGGGAAAPMTPLGSDGPEIYYTTAAPVLGLVRGS